MVNTEYPVAGLPGWARCGVEPGPDSVDQLLTRPLTHSLTHPPTRSAMPSAAHSLAHVVMVRSSLLQLCCQQDRQRPPLAARMVCAVGEGLTHSPC